MSDYEAVYTITDCYDGARSGVADLNGKPHYYETHWDALGAMMVSIFDGFGVEAAATTGCALPRDPAFFFFLLH